MAGVEKKDGEGSEKKWNGSSTSDIERLDMGLF